MVCKLILLKLPFTSKPNLNLIFQDNNAVWSAETPSIPICFEQTALVWTPCAFVWVFAILEVFYMKNNLSRNIPWSILNILKLLVNVLLIALAAVDLGFAVSRRSNGEAIYDVDIVTPVVKMLTFVSIII